MAQHLIERQILETSLRSSDGARAIESELEFMLAHGVWPTLEDLCDQLDDATQTLHIDRLVIDLGSMRQDELKSRWSHELAGRFEQQLRQLAARATVDDVLTANPRLTSPAMSGVINEDVPAASIRRSAAARLDALCFFLRHGLLPWWADAASLDVSGLIRGDEASVSERLRDTLADAPACQRLSRQFSSDIVRAVLLLLAPASAASMVAVHERVLRHVAPALPKAEALMEIESLLLAKAARHSEQKHIDRRPKPVRSEPPLTADSVRGKAPITPPRRGRTSAEPMSSVLPQGTTSTPPLPVPTALECVPPPPEADLRTSVAGLVLLCPFIERCFETLHLLDERSFRNAAARERALHLLHFMVTGEEGAHEHLITLPKLLCGMSLEESVSFAVGLTEDEKAETDSLLRSVVAHWPRMENTSIQGLRISFLQREGRLSLPEDGAPLPGWKLQVESTGYDILLDQLPWSRFLVKLPWMPQPLFVEW